MYIYESDIDVEKLEIVIEGRYYPKETIVFDVDENFSIFPVCVRVINSVPKIGNKISIEVVDNGYVIKCGNKTKLSLTDNYETQLEKMIPVFLNHNIESERELTEKELAEDNYIEAVQKLHEGYNELHEH